MERINTTIFNANTLEHLHRYALVRDIVKGKVVLDIASGEGYGSNLLAKNAREVFGVDICAETINNAKSTYRADNLKFVQGDAANVPFQPNTFDVIICFETIEHVINQDAVMRELKRVLKNDGVLVISTPEKKKYSDDKNFKNPFHTKEFYEHEFKAFLTRYFRNTNYLYQYMTYGSSIHYESKVEIEEVLTGNYTTCEKITYPNPTYILALCSDEECPKIHSSLYNSEQLNTDILLELVNKSKEEEYVLIKKTSLTYRFINILNVIKVSFSGFGNRTKL